MYQPRPLIALICLLDLMLTMFFASLLMTDPTDAAPSAKPAAAPQVEKPDAAKIEAANAAAEKLKAELAERDKVIAGLQAKINQQATPQRPAATDDVRELKQQLQAFQVEFADARSMSGKWRGSWDCEEGHMDVEFELRGFANGRVVQLGSWYNSSSMGTTSQVTAPSVEGYLRRDGSLDIARTYNTLDAGVPAWNRKYRALGMVGTVSGDTYEGYLLGCEIHGKRWFKLIRE